MTEDNHTTFYQVYQRLKDDGFAAGFILNRFEPDQLDALLWRALGHRDVYQFQTRKLTLYDKQRLALLYRSPHRVTLLKMMLLKVHDEVG